jgi:hypothetical protein
MTRQSWLVIVSSPPKGKWGNGAVTNLYAFGSGKFSSPNKPPMKIAQISSNSRFARIPSVATVIIAATFAAMLALAPSAALAQYVIDFGNPPYAVGMVLRNSPGLFDQVGGFSASSGGANATITATVPSGGYTNTAALTQMGTGTFTSGYNVAGGGSNWLSGITSITYNVQQNTSDRVYVGLWQGGANPAGNTNGLFSQVDTGVGGGIISTNFAFRACGTGGFLATLTIWRPPSRVNGIKSPSPSQMPRQPSRCPFST